MNWLAWWAALCVGAAVWLCMRAPHARLRDAHEAPGASAGEAHIGSGNRGVSSRASSPRCRAVPACSRRCAANSRRRHRRSVPARRRCPVRAAACRPDSWRAQR